MKRTAGEMRAHQRMEKIGKSNDGQHQGASGRLLVGSEDS